MISLFELIFVPDVESAGEERARFAPDEPVRVAAFISGDRDAFNWVFSEYSEALYRFVFRYLKDEESSREMVQESFLRLFANRKALSAKKGLRGYLFSIALNGCYDQLRRSRRQRFDSLEKRIESTGMHPVDERISVENREILSQMESRLEEILEELPDRQRQALLLKKTASMTFDEIGDAIGVSKRHAKRLTYQAISHIVATLDREGLTEKGELVL